MIILQCVGHVAQSLLSFMKLSSRWSRAHYLRNFWVLGVTNCCHPEDIICAPPTIYEPFNVMSLPTEHTLNVMKLRQQFTWLLVALGVEWLNLKWQWPKSWENQLVSGGSIFEINCRSCYKQFIATLGKHDILYAWFGIKTYVTILTTFSWNTSGSLSWSCENYLENVGSLGL